MTGRLESTQQSKMDPVASSWKLTVTDRRLMWLQKQHPGAAGHKLQLWASGPPPKVPSVPANNLGHDEASR
jgi:hypothetical protein